MRCIGLKQLAIVLVAGFVGVASAGVSAVDLKQQSSSEGGVIVRATPRDLSPAATVWEIEIVLETHSQDLSDDLKAIATLAAEGGSKQAPTAWEGDPPGGHHRKGVLRFSPIKPSPQTIELVILRPRESAARTFRWQTK